MGILMLKLNEYRISSNKMNQPLEHVTVLEEAHHILPRVSTQTSQESGNIKGKAVEMLSNAIAEMRTYGQAFVIVDQSPNMLDISAIRNTNTKIIMRLSELEDRNDIGKSAALDDEQINEIPKLPVGVAIVYQNGWEEAVLCKISTNETKKYIYTYSENCDHKKQDINKIIKYLVLRDTNILTDLEELDIIEEFEKDEELKKYLAINTLKDRIQTVQQLVDASEFRNLKKITAKKLSSLIREKIVIENTQYEKLLMNYLLIDFSKNSSVLMLRELQSMIENNNIVDFISREVERKKQETNEGEAKNG
jgi:hypothetical protein